MHADQLTEIEAAAATVRQERPTPHMRYPWVHPTWKEARAAYPGHAMIRIVDLVGGKQYVSPIHPFDDCSDYALDGRTYVVNYIDGDGRELPDEDLVHALRACDALSPYIPRR